jgi:FtsP/CotA-like multicopper oxidase with cupredoxin domain
MAVYDLNVRSNDKRPRTARADRGLFVPPRQPFVLRWLAAVVAVMLLQTLPAQAQRLPADECQKAGEPFYWIPELVRKPQENKLRETILLGDELRRLNDGALGGDCALVYLRYFKGVDAVPPPGSPPAPPPKYINPVPGPTLRARVGDLVELTFLNQVNPLDYGGTLDRGDDAGACDQFSVGSGSVSPTVGYPANASDTFPNCFHGSSTANIHFHGTHTNPNSTGDNVFLNIRPSPRSGGEPIVTAASVKVPFDKFFLDCEANLKGNVLSEWPLTWRNALPSDWTQKQENLLKAYDAGTDPYFPPPKPKPQQIWPPDQNQLEGNRWPQYYVGAYPYCFQLPAYAAATWPPAPDGGVRMGQAPGTHWYHAHKHGSTAVDVSNGMTGAFIIEGKYDDDLNDFYGTVGNPPAPWTRAQPTIVINQLGGNPNLVRNREFGPQPLSVNGSLQPKMTMRPGEVQLWRIVNTSSQGSAYFVGPPKLHPGKPTVDPETDFEWKQVAQDGVQFADSNYQDSLNQPIMLAPGNRADLLVKAPSNPQSTAYSVKIKQVRARMQLQLTKKNGDPVIKEAELMSVLVSGTAPENPHQTWFIPKAPQQPPFLDADITDDEVKYSAGRTFVFDSKVKGAAHQHTLNGQQFSDTGAGVTVFLNTAEEWKVINTTIGEGPVDHPFHIHINPFQIVEVFDPNETIRDPDTGKLLNKYVTNKEDLKFRELQCQLDLLDPGTWNDCHNTIQTHLIWWDVFPIPTARDNWGVSTKKVPVPGFFRMRSRFVDYPGLWVIHCHILAHEDRGMMTIVQVAPALSPGGGIQHH